ncbi:hypothetical protein AALO_G00022170 [Alosa alosa]|uniref:Hepcidin n=1 Tax=Alosa alosa TaxID=278164 RepID=A0AAV6H9H2_9TELE|nr:hypothetical protein AALO_G00022170 [Alosa alosa]
MKFLPLAIAVIFSICILHSTSAQETESGMPEEAGDVGLQRDEVMVYKAEESELPRLRAKRSMDCRFCCQNGGCGVCCSW